MTRLPRRLAFTVLALLAASPGLRAQGRLAWNEPPAVGSWAEFKMEIVDGPKTSHGTYRLSALGKARLEGEDLLWCEIVRTKGKKTRIIKVLLPERQIAASDAPLSVAKEVVYQDAGKVAMRAAGAELASVVSLLEGMQGGGPMTFESAGRDEVALPDGRRVPALRKLGRTEVKLPGQEETQVTCELWVVKDVPFGVVKRVVTTVRGSGATEERKVETLTLSSHAARGAASRITGEVKPFNPLLLLLGGR